MRRFSEVTEYLELRDIHLHEGPLTLSGGLNNQSSIRLDRLLVSKD